MKKLMILGASILQLPAIRKAKELGMTVIGLDMDPTAVGLAECDEQEIISTIDIPAVLEAARRHKIDGIMTLASDMPMRTVARVGAELGLPAISEQAAFRATDKYAMRQALREWNVPIPQFFAVTTREELQTALEQLPGDKRIVKPADSSGSRGVHLVRKGESGEQAFVLSQQFSHSGVVMVEEFMTGPEVSVEAITCGGKTEIITITDKLIVGNGNFTEIGHTQPSRLPQLIQREIEDVVRRTIQAIGIDNSPSHTECKITPEGVKVVEIGARLGGDNITTHLVPLSTGVNMVEMCIDIAAGNPIRQYERQPNTAAIRYFNPVPGQITQVRGIEQARRIPGVQEVELLHGEGEVAPPITSSTDRIGFVIAQGCNGRDAAEICEEAMSLIQITTRSAE
jgi:biotin carboxylase